MLNICRYKRRREEEGKRRKGETVVAVQAIIIDIADQQYTDDRRLSVYQMTETL